MELKANHTQLCHVLMVALALLVGAIAAEQPPSPTPPPPPPPNQTLPGCNYTCGDVEVPYPFGIGYSTTNNEQPCFLNHNFSLCCENSILYIGKNVAIQRINLEGQMLMSFFVSSLCKNTEANRHSFLPVPSFTISSRENKFIAVGCDAYGHLDGYYEGAAYSTGCVTGCDNSDPEVDIGNSDGRCTGLGCCQVAIPPRMKDITIQVSMFPKSSLSKNKKSCSYSFIAKEGSYNFSVNDLRKLRNKTFPLIVNWAVADAKCEIAKKNKSDYACKANSECVDKDTDYDYDGYRCKCKDGFEGNPYLPDGCRETLKHH